MRYLDEKCPLCAGQMAEKEVEKLLRGGKNMAVVKVYADVCLHCGERYYSSDTVRKFENVEFHLQNNETQDFQVLGYAYQIA